MRRPFVTVLAICALAAACGGKGTPTEPSSSTGPSSSSSSSGPASPSASDPGPGNPGNAEARVEGVIEALPPATPPLTFRAAGRTVVTTAATQFKDGSLLRTFADLRIGMRVEAKGTSSGDSITATRIEIEEEDENEPPQPPKNPEASITGTLRTIAGAAPALTLTVNTTTVRTAAATTVKRRGNPLTLAALQVGQTLEVEGTRRPDGSIDAQKITIEDDENEDEDDEVELQGTMSGLTGTCPTISFTVSSVAFTTNASTRFDDTACSAFRNGDRVEVRGNRASSGPVIATRLRKKS
jgi:hypothetical protein